MKKLLNRLFNRWKKYTIIIPIENNYNGLKTTHKIKFQVRERIKTGVIQIMPSMYINNNTVPGKWRTVNKIPEKIYLDSTFDF